MKGALYGADYIICYLRTKCAEKFNIIRDTQPEFFFGGEDIVEGCLGGLIFFP